MAVQTAVIVLADIGGYTRFMSRLQESLVHAEATITELLNAVIDATEHPLILNKLEGDAAFFYSPATPETLPQVARSALQQVNGFFQAFEQRKREMQRDVMCDCGACVAVGDLSIKAVLHCGEVTIRQFRRFEELTGMPVITAHRLMKNSVPVKEYLLTTEVFNKAAGGMPGQQGTPLVEDCEGVGKVNTVYYIPDRTLKPEPAAPNRWRQMKFMARMMAFFTRRRLGLTKNRKFSSLEALNIPLREGHDHDHDHGHAH